MAENRVYEDYAEEFELRSKSRDELREMVVSRFLVEKPGYWKDGVKHVTRYKYYVETLRDGRRIYLLRPTFLNKGIDFQVWVERFSDGKDKKPSHKNIVADLKEKSKENPQLFSKLMQAVEEVWDCKEPDDVLKRHSELENFSTGFTAELILKALKWLFIEQDITYWNYDGRSMLKMHLESATHN